MQTYRNIDSIHEVVGSARDAELHQLMIAHVERLREYRGVEVGEYVHFIVFEHGDTIADLDASLGFPITANRHDGIRFGEPGFIPSWECIEEHAHSFECTYVLDDSGMGVIVFIPNDTDLDLLPMLQYYARQ